MTAFAVCVINTKALKRVTPGNRRHSIGLYIGKTGIASGFGAAASLVVLLVWVYYSAQIFLLGAEFTWVYGHCCLGSRKHEPLPLPADH
jgi:uncharacterized BrkB/YihY/UPF0761 family membrane protein